MDLQDRTGDRSNFCIADVCAGISGGLLKITIKNELIQENDFCISSFFVLILFLDSQASGYDKGLLFHPKTGWS